MIVYLDSSAITNFTTLRSDTIKQLRNEKNVKFASSICHIIEALPKSASSIDQSIDRLRIIMDREYAIPVLPFSSIIDLEISSRNQDFKADIYCKWHEIIYLDDNVSSFSNIRLKTKEAIRKALENFPEGNLRRQARAKYIIRGKFRPTAVELLKFNQEAMLREAQAVLPEIAPIFQAGGLYDAILGRVDPTNFEILLRETILHPAVLAKLSFHPDFDVKPISHFFWRQSERLISIIDSQISHAAEVQSVTGMSFKDFSSAMERYFISEEYFQDTLMKLGASPNSEPGSALGTKNLLGMIAQLSLKKIQAHANPAKKIDFLKIASLKQGDFGDAMHCMYQPYVDIFCCDKRTKLLLEKFVRNADNICCSEAELLSRTEGNYKTSL
ncbi:hypothetical protein ACLBWX_03695 [Methylobacterium sp. M6A4_1b]